MGGHMHSVVTRIGSLFKQGAGGELLIQRGVLDRGRAHHGELSGHQGERRQTHKL